MAALVDPYGRPLTMKRPITDEIAAVTVRDRYSSYPSHGLTPERLARIFREADAGDVYRQAELFEELEEKDGHLGSVLGTRKNAVVGLEYSILPFSDEAADRRVADFVTEAIEAIAGFEDALLDALDAIGKGFSCLELMWQVEGSRAWVSEMRWRHQKRFRFDELGNLRLITDANPQGEPLPPWKFLVHVYKAKSGHPSRAGVLRVCAWMYLFKHYAVKDWVQFSEVYGLPLRLGKYDPGASPEDKAALMRALIQLGVDAAGIIPQTTDITFVETAKGGHGSTPHPGLVDFCNSEMSKAVLGQTLTTEVGSHGSYAASQTHAEVRQDLIEADAKALAERLRRDVIHPLVLFNFGPDATRRLPWFKFHFEVPEDTEKTARVYATLVRDIGLPVAAEHLYERFGVPQPQEGQELVRAPGALPAFPFSGLAQLALRQGDAERPPSVHEAQRAIDALADRALAESLPLFRALLGPIEQMALEAQSLEDLRKRLAAAYRHMDTTELEDLIGRALFVADLLGRWSGRA